MSDIVTERSGGILRVMFNRPSNWNAMTSVMYLAVAYLLNKTLREKHAPDFTEAKEKPTAAKAA